MVEETTKTCMYTGIACDRSDRQGVVACGGDGKIRDIAPLSEHGGIVVHDGTEAVVTKVTVSHSNTHLFVGTSTGMIRAYPYPLGEGYDATTFQEYPAHLSAVTSLWLTANDSVRRRISFIIFSVAKYVH